MNAITLRDNARHIVEEISGDLKDVLPSNITLDRFRATFITAVAHNPDILRCETQSIKTALMKAATDNLMPDNREAALVPFNTKIKGPDGKERYGLLAQYMPMVQGIRKRALELGGARIHAECVYENDHFDAILGDDPRIEHKPAKFGQVRGEVIGVYAIFKDESGNILHRELMSRDDVEATRKVSKSANGPAWSGFFAEMAKKAAVRRGAKSLPNLPDKLRDVIERDDEYVDFTPATERNRTIEHNPLLESNTQQPMEGVSNTSGDIIDAETVDAADTNSSRQSSSLAEDDKAAEPDSPTGSAATKFVFTADEAKKYASWLARQGDAEKVEKGSAHFFENEGRSPVKGSAEHRLFGSIYTRNRDRAEGKIEATGLIDEINQEIDTIYGLNDFPGDK